MLVLTRKLGQKVFIGDDIVVTVVKTTDHQTILGFDAPKDLSIHREEIHDKIQEKVKANRKTLSLG